MMNYSGLYFVSTPANTPDAALSILTHLIQNLETRFDYATRQNPWGLTHRLLRSVPTANSPPSHQHILQLSYLSQTRTYCYIQPASTQVKSEPVKTEPKPEAETPEPGQVTTAQGAAADAGTIISIPAAQSETQIGLLVNQLSAQWTFQRAHSVANGQTYTTGQFIVNIGELRQSRLGSASMSNAVSAGVVVCITTIADGDDDSEAQNDSGYETVGAEAEEDEIDLGEAQEAVRAFWGILKESVGFGKGEVREAMLGTKVLKGEKQREAVVRMWCELLRHRG